MTSINELIIEELQAKTSYEAKWEAFCDYCGSQIEVGDSFIFLGDKRKICIPCTEKIEEDLGGEND